MRDDLCFRCTLPDCDDRSPRCAVRQAQRSYYRKVRTKRHEQITDEEREANNRVFEAWHLDRAAEASEGGRPYKRNAVDYGQASAGVK